MKDESLFTLIAINLDTTQIPRSSKVEYDILTNGALKGAKCHQPVRHNFRPVRNMYVVKRAKSHILR
jgi:hypothetical protein